MSDFAYLDGHHSIIGASDSGKTWTAKYGVEELLRQRRHTLIIDPLGVYYGMRSSADGKGPGFDIPIFGGLHGDVPIVVGDGEAIGGIIDDQRVSAIVDLSLITDGLGQRTFVRALVARLRRRRHGNFHFVVDEADEFVPEKPRDDVAFALQEDMLWIAKKGRSPAGWVLTLITQRTADIAKSALSQSQTIIAHQLIAPQDQKPFLDYIRTKGTKAELAEIESNLASLPQGDRYIYSPRRRILELGRTPALTTFDSSRTPEAGQSRREPRTLAQLDVSKIRKALAPKRAEPPTGGGGASRESDAESKAAAMSVRHSDQRIERLELQIADLRAEVESVRRQRDWFENRIAEIRALTSVRVDRRGEDQEQGGVAADSESAGPSPSTTSRPKQADVEAAPNASADAPDREYRALAGLAAVFPAGLTEAAWAARTGYSRKGGAWNRRRKRYLDAGLIEQQGDRWRATQVGVDQVGADIPDMPKPGLGLVKWWSARLGAPGRALELLAAVHPKALTRDAIAAELRMSARGGAFNRHISALKAAELVTETRKRLAIEPALIGEDA